MRVSSFSVLVTCLGILLCLGLDSDRSQSAATGTVSGRAPDSSNVILAAAQVKPLDTSTDITFTTLSDDTVRRPLPISHTNRFGDALECQLIPKVIPVRTFFFVVQPG